MSVIINHTYEGAESAATLGYYTITQLVGNASGNGLSASTYGLRSAHATLINRFYGTAMIATPAMAGRCFTVEAELDHADYLNTNDYNELFALRTGAVGSNSGFLWVRHGDLDDGINPVVQRAIWVLAASGGGGATIRWQSAANVFSVGTKIKVKIIGVMSSSPTVPFNDGSFKIYLDDVLQFSETALDLRANNGATGNVFSEMKIGPMGRFDNFIVTDDCEVVDEADPVPTNDSTPCCGDSVAPSSGGSTVGDALPNNPYQALQAWTPACVGGGTVPSAADLTDSESWA